MSDDSRYDEALFKTSLEDSSIKKGVKRYPITALDGIFLVTEDVVHETVKDASCVLERPSFHLRLRGHEETR